MTILPREAVNIAAATAIENVIAAAAVERVIAGAGRDAVVAEEPPHAIVDIGAAQHVIAGRAFQVEAPGEQLRVGEARAVREIEALDGTRPHRVCRIEAFDVQSLSPVADTDEQ